LDDKVGYRSDSYFEQGGTSTEISAGEHGSDHEYYEGYGSPDQMISDIEA